MAAVRASESPISQPLVEYHLNENVSMPKPGSGQALVRVFGSSVNLVNVFLVELICEDFGVFRGDHGTDIAGVIVTNLMYDSEADVAVLRTPQPGYASLWIRSSQPCTLRVRTRGVSVTTL